MAIALLVACISRITGDMVLSRSPQGKAFGATVIGRGSPSPASHFGPPADRAKHPLRIAHGVHLAGPRFSTLPRHAARPATPQTPVSAVPLSLISLVGPIPIDGDLLNPIPGGDVVPEVGEAGPMSGPPADVPPDMQIVPPAAGGPPGGGPGSGAGGPGQPPPIGPPGGGSGAPPPTAPSGGSPGGGGPGPPPPVAGVPEPSTWSMLVFALLGLGVPLRLSGRPVRFGP